MVIKGEINTHKVWIDGIELLPKQSLEVVNHSPSGFSWGYRGSGCSQLALAILLKYTTHNKALAYYRYLRDDFIANLPQEDFEGVFDLDEWMQKQV